MSAILQLFAAGGSSPPSNTVAPVVSGTAMVGVTLSCTTGTWVGDAPISYAYQWQRSGVNISGATGSTYSLVLADQSATVRCVVTATNAVNSVSATSNSTATVQPATGQQAFTTPGTYSWTAPAGVTSISVVTVGAGNNGYMDGDGNNLGGGGGALAYKNNYAVTPGNSYAVEVGAIGGRSFFISLNHVCGESPAYTSGSRATYTGDGGGRGGMPGGVFDGSFAPPGGGGAGGYAGDGGSGGTKAAGLAGDGGGGGGGGGQSTSGSGTATAGSGGGGVGLLGQGANGAGGSGGTTTTPGGGGSGGTTGSAGLGYLSGKSGGGGGLYGGGGGAHFWGGTGGNGATGAVRIIWPGTTRQFPSTNTTNM